MRVLIVEDDKSQAYLLRRVLSEDGYAIDVATTGEEARVLAAVNQYDGVILDLQLADRHGLAILQEVRRTVLQTPVLVYTGKSDTQSIIRALDAGADEYVVKPVSNDEMRARVRAPPLQSQRVAASASFFASPTHLRLPCSRSKNPGEKTDSEMVTLVTK